MSYGFTSFLTTYGVYLFVFFSINFGLSFIGAAMAKEKGYSYGGFLCLGMFTAFWLSIIIAASCTPRAGSRYIAKKNMEQHFRNQDLQAQPIAYQPVEASAALCTSCGANVTSIMAFCPSCGVKDPAKPKEW